MKGIYTIKNDVALGDPTIRGIGVGQIILHRKSGGVFFLPREVLLLLLLLPEY